MIAIEVPMAEGIPEATPARPELHLPATPLEGIVTLCIENEPQVLAGMESLLSGWGCQMIAASGLSAALAAMASGAQRPDVLLVDYHLDDGNGIDAIVALRQQLGARIPAALVTADRSPAVRDEARANDIQVLNKPVKPAMLRAFLAQWRVAHAAE